MSAATMLAAALTAQFDAAPPARLGLALSGGGDSTALAVLLAEWGRDHGVEVVAASVDHGLRPEATGECQAAAALCRCLGIVHTTLAIRKPLDRGNLQDRARRARYARLAAWAQESGVRHVALAHTRDDQAETVLLRLARGAGVDGLAGMAPARRDGGVTWLRPLLGVARSDLREVLRARDIGWCEDPTNADPRFDRVKARRALAALAPLGFDAAGLAATAGRMATARTALDSAADALARTAACRIDAGDVLLDSAALRQAAEETRLRLLARALRWVASGDYAPRRAALQRAWRAIAAGRTRTLGGCLLLVRGGTLRIVREPAAVAGTSAAPGALWDGRWRLLGPRREALTVAALGADGLAACPAWRATGRPRAALLSTPAVWAGASLVAAPLAGRADGWRAECAQAPIPAAPACDCR